jgi:pimeloyl-ACP methyl ester carboxylesterase
MSAGDILEVEARRGESVLRVMVQGEGPPLLYLHGLTSLAATARLEAPRGFRLAVFDQRGHGSGTPFLDPAAYALEEFSADAVAVLDALEWERAALGGMSMGSAVAMDVALSHRRRVDALLLAGPAEGAEFPDAASIADMDETADVLQRHGLATAIQLTRASLLAEGLPVEATAFLDVWTAHDAQALAVAIRTVMRWRPFPDLAVLRQIEVPVAVLGWPGDPLHPQRLAERVAQVTGGALGMVEHLAEVLADPNVVSEGLSALWGSAANEQERS